MPAKVVTANAIAQVITAYTKCNMTVEQIAEDLDYEVPAVKLALDQYCPAFQKEVDAGNIEVFSKDDEELAKEAIRSLVTESRIDSVKMRAAEFIINERKGRNDLAGSFRESKFNITIISETMSKAREAMAKARVAANEKKQKQLTVDV